ncbi:hypothetical protein B0H34DRAFT_689989 [Crassisporium funariophilum]|nr:hypothetical protein B0H34DRAFT_689989 [Crassisporium funariophilum]
MSVGRTNVIDTDTYLKNRRRIEDAREKLRAFEEHNEEGKQNHDEVARALQEKIRAGEEAKRQLERLQQQAADSHLLAQQNNRTSAIEYYPNSGSGSRIEEVQTYDQNVSHNQQSSHQYYNGYQNMSSYQPYSHHAPQPIASGSRSQPGYHRENIFEGQSRGQQFQQYPSNPPPPTGRIAQHGYQPTAGSYEHNVPQIQSFHHRPPEQAQNSLHYEAYAHSKGLSQHGPALPSQHAPQFQRHAYPPTQNPSLAVSSHQRPAAVHPLPPSRIHQARGLIASESPNPMHYNPTAAANSTSSLIGALGQTSHVPNTTATSKSYNQSVDSQSLRSSKQVHSNNKQDVPQLSTANPKGASSSTSNPVTPISTTTSIPKVPSLSGLPSTQADNELRDRSKAAKVAFPNTILTEAQINKLRLDISDWERDAAAGSFFNVGGSHFRVHKSKDFVTRVEWPAPAGGGTYTVDVNKFLDDMVRIARVSTLNTGADALLHATPALATVNQVSSQPQTAGPSSGQTSTVTLSTQAPLPDAAASSTPLTPPTLTLATAPSSQAFTLNPPLTVINGIVRTPKDAVRKTLAKDLMSALGKHARDETTPTELLQPQPKRHASESFASQGADVSVTAPYKPHFRVNAVSANGVAQPLSYPSSMSCFSAAPNGLGGNLRGATFKVNPVVAKGMTQLPNNATFTSTFRALANTALQKPSENIPRIPSGVHPVTSNGAAKPPAIASSMSTFGGQQSLQIAAPQEPSQISQGATSNVGPVTAKAVMLPSNGGSHMSIVPIQQGSPISHHRPEVSARPLMAPTQLEPTSKPSTTTPGIPVLALADATSSTLALTPAPSSTLGGGIGVTPPHRDSPHRNSQQVQVVSSSMLQTHTASMPQPPVNQALLATSDQNSSTAPPHAPPSAPVTPGGPQPAAIQTAESFPAHSPSSLRANLHGKADARQMPVVIIDLTSPRPSGPIASSSKLKSSSVKQPLFLPSSSPEVSPVALDTDELDIITSGRVHGPGPDDESMSGSVNKGKQRAYVMVPEAPDLVKQYWKQRDRARRRAGKTASGSRGRGERTVRSVTTPVNGEEDFYNTLESPQHSPNCEWQVACIPVEWYNLKSKHTSDDREQEAVRLASSRLQELPCKWDRCDVVMNSVESLIRHLNLQHKPSTPPNSSNLYFMCKWTQCGRRCNIREKHLEKHANLPLRCAYEDCEESYRSASQLLKHFQAHHSDDRLKPSAGLCVPKLEPLVPAPGVVPTYTIVTRKVSQRPISKGRHEALQPWVLRNIAGLEQSRKSRKNVRSSNRDNIPDQEARDDYEFLTARSHRYSSHLSQPVNMKIDDLNSVRISEMVDEGLTLWPGEKTSASDTDSNPPDSPSLSRNSHFANGHINQEKDGGPSNGSREHSDDEDAVEIMLTEVTMG